MQDLKSDTEQSEQIRDGSRQFTSVMVLLRQNTHKYVYAHIHTKYLK